MARIPTKNLLVMGFGTLLLSACATMSPKTPGPEAVFATPEEAVTALAEANRKNDDTAVIKILGPAGEDLIHSGDPVADANHHDKFMNAYDKMHRLDSINDNKSILVVGDEEWPLPIPLVAVTGGWQFDTDTGTQEIINRRIGHNELDVIQVCRAYVDAQKDFSALNRSREYAQKFVSTKGKHDGLYWPVKAGTAESPLGELIADARADGYTPGEGKHAPYRGYFYKILKAQGSNASGGGKSYIVNGRMTDGFALLAFPAKYGDSGVMTFMINQNGIIYQKNLGPDTTTIAAGIDSYDPDPSWKTSDESIVFSSDDFNQ